ncbi:MAG: hypothetical protein FWD25_10405 [Clostridia bacterium]|nr:hypothetical protein [Clostridia bacterium]
MDQPKKWMRGVLIAFALLLACCAFTVYLADPYQVYRLASWFTPLYSNGEQAYYNPGLARHSDYDAVFLGTSMVENTLVSQVDERFGTRCVKLPFQGGMAGNHAKVLQIAFDTRPLTHVFYGMDMYSFVRDPKFSSFEMPLYLYDNNPFNRVAYLLNGDVLLRHIPGLLHRQLTGEEPEPVTADTIYAWGLEENIRYGEKDVLGSYDFTQPAQEMLAYDAFADHANANFDRYVRPFLEEHPDTEFIFFFPPYSALEWPIMHHRGHLDAVLHTMEQLAELLLPYPNARLHDFTANLDWIEDFGLYKDYSHYSPAVNAWIVDALANGDFLVHDLFDIYDSIDMLEEIAENFSIRQGG